MSVCLFVWTHFQDKQGIPWWLGVSYKGIGQYDLQDKLKPRTVGPPVFTTVSALKVFKMIIWKEINLIPYLTIWYTFL